MACYQVTAVDVVAQEGPASDPACIGPVTTKTRAMQEQHLPIQPRILASPNTFNPATTIAYRLPPTSYVLLTVYYVRGTRVATLVSGERPAGDHIVRWEGRSDSGNPVASGAYFALLRAGNVQLKEKLILLK